MKILQLMAGGKHGGAENFFVRLVTALAEEGIVQQAAIRTHRQRRDRLERSGIPVHELRYGGMFDLRTAGKLKKIARDFKPDIVMSWMNRSSAMAPAGPWINVGRLGGYYNLKYYKKCAYLICNTPALCDYVISRGRPKENVVCLANFIDETVAPAIDRAQFDTPDDKPLIVCFGRLHDNKAFDVIIAALNKIEHAYLWIVGEGPLSDQLQQLAKDHAVLDRIRFLGWRDDISAIHAAADVFVCPSRHEPLGNVILEAWAYGTPVVAARSQGPAQLISEGETGLLVPVDDADSLAESIKQVLENQALAVRLKDAGKKAYFEKFSRDKVVKKYVEFLSGIYARRTGLQRA